MVKSPLPGFPLGGLSVIIGKAACGECGDERDLSQCYKCGDPRCEFHGQDKHQCGADGCRHCGAPEAAEAGWVPWCSPCLAEATGNVGVNLVGIGKGGSVRDTLRGIDEVYGPIVRDVARIREILEEDAGMELAHELMGQAGRGLFDGDSVFLEGLPPDTARRIAEECEAFEGAEPTSHTTVEGRKIAWIKARARLARSRQERP